MELYQIFVVFGFIGWLLAGQWAQSKRTKLADRRADTHERQIDELDKCDQLHSRGLVITGEHGRSVNTKLDAEHALVQAQLAVIDAKADIHEHMIAVSGKRLDDIERREATDGG